MSRREPESVSTLALRERDIYRTALVEIADSESGVWGTIANTALRQAAELRDEATR